MDNSFDAMVNALKVGLVCALGWYCFGPVGVAVVALALLLKSRKK